MNSWGRGFGDGYEHLHLVIVQALFFLLLFFGRIRGKSLLHKMGNFSNLPLQHEAFYRDGMFSPNVSLLLID